MWRVCVALAFVALTMAASPNDKLKKCCSELKGVDNECVTRFCDFKAISQTNV